MLTQHLHSPQSGVKQPVQTLQRSLRFIHFIFFFFNGFACFVDAGGFLDTDLFGFNDFFAGTEREGSVPG